MIFVEHEGVNMLNTLIKIIVKDIDTDIAFQLQLEDIKFSLLCPDLLSKYPHNEHVLSLIE